MSAADLAVFAVGIFGLMEGGYIGFALGGSALKATSKLRPRVLRVVKTIESPAVLACLDGLAVVEFHPLLGHPIYDIDLNNCCSGDSEMMK
jgi:hypothetical protein